MGTTDEAAPVGTCPPPQTDASALEGLGPRMGLVMMHLRLSQTELASQLGMSSSFVSDVVRGAKKPGSEFLFGLRRQFGISIDWLLTGEGAMQGFCAIDLERLREIEFYLALAHAAIVDGDVTAKVLFALVRDNKLDPANADPVITEFLERLVPSVDDVRTATVLYNGLAGLPDEPAIRSYLFAAVTGHCEAKKPLDAMSALSRKVNEKLQINVGHTVHASMNFRKS